MEGADSDLIGIAIGIEYVDSGGANISRRWITINKLAETDKGHLAVEVYCLMRNYSRTFWVSRIVEIFYEDCESFHVRSFFEIGSKARNGGPHIIGSRKLECRDGLRVLIALARADGDLHPTMLADGELPNLCTR